MTYLLPFSVIYNTVKYSRLVVLNLNCTLKFPGEFFLFVFLNTDIWTSHETLKTFFICLHQNFKNLSYM